MPLHDHEIGFYSMHNKYFDTIPYYEYPSNTIIQYRQCRQTGGEGTPHPAFHILSKDMTLNRGETHFTIGLRPCIILSSFYKHTCAPSQNYPFEPLGLCNKSLSICLSKTDLEGKTLYLEV